MKWADKVDLAERATASDEAVLHLMSPWAKSNLWTRSMRDHINEQARKASAAETAESDEPLSISMFLSVADMKAEQQRQMAEQAREQGWR